MRILNVSRGTIREALRGLTNEGILYSVRGHGTYVKEMEKSSWAVNTFLSVAESFDHTNTDYSTRILEIGCGEADTDVAAQLQVPPLTQVVFMHRLRLIKDEPVHLSTSYLPFTIAAPLLEIDLNDTSLYRVMDEKLGLRVTRVDRRVFARLADNGKLNTYSCQTSRQLWYLKELPSVSLKNQWNIPLLAFLLTEANSLFKAGL
jgi:GntR family transcriptional regulator